MYAAIQKLYFEVNINQHNCTDQAAEERNHFTKRFTWNSLTFVLEVSCGVPLFKARSMCSFQFLVVCQWKIISNACFTWLLWWSCVIVWLHFTKRMFSPQPKGFDCSFDRSMISSLLLLQRLWMWTQCELLEISTCGNTAQSHTAPNAQIFNHFVPCELLKSSCFRMFHATSVMSYCHVDRESPQGTVILWHVHFMICCIQAQNHRHSVWKQTIWKYFTLK